MPGKMAARFLEGLIDGIAQQIQPGLIETLLEPDDAIPPEGLDIFLLHQDRLVHPFVSRRYCCFLGQAGANHDQSL